MIPNENAVEAGSAAVERLAKHPVFQRAEGSLALLRFLISVAEEYPAGMKEASLGVAFYKREPTYDPRYDPIVRVNIKRLRERLAVYYANGGQVDPVRFDIPLGAYKVVTTRVHANAESSLPDALVASSTDVSREPLEMAPADDWTAPESAAIAPLAGNEAKRSPYSRIVVAACVCLALLVTALGWSHYAGKKTRAATIPHPRLHTAPLTDGREMQFEPATNRSGSRLAYVARVAGTQDYRIFLRAYSPVESQAMLLDTGHGDAFYPKWSPDGQQIAFLHCGQGPCEIATVSIRGGTVKTVRVLPDYERPVDHPYYQYRQLNPVWARGKSALVYPYRGLADDAERLVSQDLVTGAIRQLTSGVAGDEDGAPALAADGRTIAFLRRHLTVTQVMTVDMDSLQTRVLTTEPNGAVSGLTWGPGDQYVVIGANRNATSVLLVVPLHGAPYELESGTRIAANPVLATGGKTLMFLEETRGRNLVQATSTAAPVPLFTTRQRNTVTAASPDGKHLAFLSDLSGSFELWMLDRTADGWSPGRQITRGLPFYPSSITWSPDQRYVAVGLSNTATLEIVNTTNGTRVPLRVPGLEQSVIWSPQWSGSGRWIYVAAQGEKRGIFRVSTGPIPEVQQVYAGSAHEIRLDGDRAVYFAPSYRNGILRLPLRNGEPSGEPVQAVAGLEHLVTGRAWLVESGHLLSIDAQEQVARLHSLDLRSGRSNVVSGPLPRVAFTDGTLSYLGREHALIYCEWGEAAGSQVFAAELPELSQQ